MSAVWRKRLAIVLGTWASVVIAMTALKMDPRPVVLAGIVAVVAASICLLLDVSDMSMPLSWRVERDLSGIQRGADTRIGLLQRQMVYAPVRQDAGLVHGLLVDLVDDRLSTEHAIDRRTDPARAAAVLGPDLAAFISSGPSAASLGDARFMSMILSRIESL